MDDSTRITDEKLGIYGAYYLNRQVVHDKTKIKQNGVEIDTLRYFYQIHGQLQLVDTADLLKLRTWLSDPAAQFNLIVQLLLKFDSNKFKAIYDLASKGTLQDLGRWEVGMKVSNDRPASNVPLYWLEAKVEIPLEDVNYPAGGAIKDPLRLMYDLISGSPGAIAAISAHVYNNPDYPFVPALIS